MRNLADPVLSPVVCPRFADATGIDDLMTAHRCVMILVREPRECLLQLSDLVLGTLLFGVLKGRSVAHVVEHSC